MTYAQVASIIGSPGKELSHSFMPGFMIGGADFDRVPAQSASIFAWINPDGSNMNATFQNDRLTVKAQFGLR